MYYIWTDESDKDGKYYTNFYGGILIDSIHYKEVIDILSKCVADLNIDEEIKWQKVSAYWFERYKHLLDIVFDLLKNNKIKIRIFFKNRQYVTPLLTPQQRRAEYQLLYYQFIKHAFGLEYSNKQRDKDIFVRFYIDDMPLKSEDKQEFIDYLFKLNDDKDFKKARIKIRKRDISEVNSKEHLPLQIMDLILGSMCFRLNDKHKEKPAGSKVRGAKTRVKEALYKYINQKIREIIPNFNIGEGTSYSNVIEIWESPYRHWSFRPKGYERDKSFSKKAQKK